MRSRLLFAASLILAASAGPASAQPEPWQLGFQSPATPIMAWVENFHFFLLILISVIVALILALLAFCAVRFNEKANPKPSKTSHHTGLEIAWTLIPALILIVIAFPSFQLMRTQLATPQAELTIKATGHQWFWEYEYPDHKFDFASIMLDPEDLKPGQPRLLATDNPVIVPVDTNVRVIVTAADVLHAFSMPAFGIKIDAVPGRLNETWFRATQTGTFYGQCSELCGERHAFMPIEIHVVSKPRFRSWLRRAKNEFAQNPAPLAAAAGTAAEAKP